MNPGSLLIYSQTNQMKEDSALNNQQVTKEIDIYFNFDYSNLFLET